MQSSSLYSHLSSIADNLISSFIYPTLLLVIGASRKLITSSKWVVRSVTAQVLALQIAASATALAALLYADVFLVCLLWIFALIAAPWAVLHDLRALGIGSGFLKTSRGMSFDVSLKQITRQLSFLGIGADKLTKSEFFEAAMQRCATGGNVARFLLSDPNNPVLERMARRNGVDPELYKRRVRESLRRLSSLHQNDALNIEVRLYSNSVDRDYQRFRLMFVDETYCLLSWTVWGSHEGRENPQIILRSVVDREAGDSTLYKAFNDHFESIWESSSPYDLKQNP